MKDELTIWRDCHALVTRHFDTEDSGYFTIGGYWIGTEELVDALVERGVTIAKIDTSEDKRD